MCIRDRAKSATSSNQVQDPQAQINWISLDDVDTGDQRLHNFRFLPARELGVYADIDEASSPFDAFV